MWAGLGRAGAGRAGAARAGCRPVALHHRDELLEGRRPSFRRREKHFRWEFSFSLARRGPSRSRPRGGPVRLNYRGPPVGQRARARPPQVPSGASSASGPFPLPAAPSPGGPVRGRGRPPRLRVQPGPLRWEPDTVPSCRLSMKNTPLGAPPQVGAASSSPRPSRKVTGVLAPW